LDHHPLSNLCDLTEPFQLTDQPSDMSRFTVSDRDETRDRATNPESSAPIQSRPATPDIENRRTSNKAHRFVAHVEKKMEKGLEMMRLGKQKNRGQGGAQDAGAAPGENGSTEGHAISAEGTQVAEDSKAAPMSSRARATALTTVLNTAIPLLIPGPFQGPAETLLKMIDIVQARVCNLYFFVCGSLKYYIA
jgi:hypothetical protein